MIRSLRQRYANISTRPTDTLLSDQSKCCVQFTVSDRPIDVCSALCGTRCVVGSDHCFSILAFTMTSFHLAISLISSAWSSSGVLPWGTTLSSAKRCFTSGSASTALISLLSKSITGRGVFAGAAMPFHEVTS